MLVREDSIPKPIIYSNKLLFDQGDDRNKKRMAQMLKRKTALSTKNKKEHEKNISPTKSPLIQKSNKKYDSFITNINPKNDVNNKNIDNTVGDNDLASGIKLENNNNICDIKKLYNCENNIINLDCSPILSNNGIFNENNYYNNSSTNNSNNNSIINRDSQEKEVNISNLDNDSIDDIIINKEDNNPEEDCLNINNENEKIFSKSLYNYEHDSDNIYNKEEKKIKEENEYALKYLTSSSDSFVQLDNHLVARAKAQGGEITESYYQALFPNLMLDSNKTLKNKNYDGIEIIKEEREIDSPFRNSGYFSKKSKTSRISLDINSNLKKEDYIENIKKGKKSLVKTKSNAMLLNKRLNINNKEKNKKMLKDTKNKTVSSFKNIKKIIKNNTIEIKRNKIEKNEKEKLTTNNSHLNLNINKIINNKMNLKIKNDLKFNSTYTSNLYLKGKTERRQNKNIRNQNQNNIKSSFTNLLDIESELNNVSLIHNCVKNIGKSKNIKINKHYLKNINFYDNYEESNNKNKIINKRNQNKNELNEFNLDSTLLTTSSKTNRLNTTDITKKSNFFLKSYNSNKNLNINLNNNITSFNKINNHPNRRYIHKNCVSSLSFNENTKPKKYLTKKDRVQSSSRLILRKHHISDKLNTESFIKRTKTNNKKMDNIQKFEYINTETSSMKMKVRKKNNNIISNFVEERKKIIPFHKKNDYSYVKAKVETGLSEDILKKLYNNNKKLNNKETNKKNDKNEKQSLLKKCKTSMNRTIENFKNMASNFKKKILKKNKK